MTATSGTNEVLPYGRQDVDEADIEAVIEVLRSDFLTTGPAVRAFEAQLERVTGARYAYALNSGTSALHAMYAVHGIGAGDEIIVPPLTFAATANAALYLGAHPVFADVEEDSGCIDPSAVDAAVTQRTKAIVAVDYAGHPADYEALRSISTSRGLALLGDAAHSLGASVDGRRVGTLADATMLSFHPVKAITTAEGGAIVTDDPSLGNAITEFRSHGVTRDTDLMENADGPWSYEVRSIGFNYRLSDVHAALGLSQLARLEAFVRRRQEIADAYSKAFAGLPIQLPVTRPGVEPAWHLYVVRAPNGEMRKRLYEVLRSRGVGVQVHFLPTYRHPLYRNAGYPQHTCPRADAFYDGALSLPIFPRMTGDDVGRVIDEVRTAVGSL
jgi:UDP-4-amino-4,6-dideoxy-N-acetyl-beta-L-altrosamine transaminase